MAYDEFKKLSKDYTYRGEGSIENINAGSLQRIADATELMAKNFLRLQEDLEWYKKRYKDISVENEKLNKRINSYKGVITKMKNKSSL